jgi:ubiquinol-cytochrome c reductase cytochrome b subunit
MSFWAATVITNLLTSLPVVGQKLIVYAHGAFSVQGATLNRFFVLHYLLAIVVIILVIYHLAVLHKEGSSNPFGPLKEIEKLHFYYYFVFKDLFFFFLVCLYLFFIVFLHPNNFNHPDNFNEANPLITPTHIVPEWYFLPFYAILRAIPNKLLGVIAMLFAIVCLFSLPFLAKFDYYNFNFSDSGYKLFFFGLLFSFLVLGYLGAMPAVAPFVSMSQRFTAFYFILFFLPLLLSPAGRAWRAVLKYFQIDKNIY